MRKSGRERKGIWKHKKSLNCPADVWTRLSVLFFLSFSFFSFHFFSCHGQVCSCWGLTSAFGWVTIVSCPHPAKADFLSFSLSLSLSLSVSLSVSLCLVPLYGGLQGWLPHVQEFMAFPSPTPHFSLFFMDDTVICLVASYHWNNYRPQPIQPRGTTTAKHNRYAVVKTLIHCTTWISRIIRDSDSLLILLIIFSDMSLELVSS